VVRLRDERLKLAVQALEEARAAELAASTDLLNATAAREQAETARRALSSMRADILDFIEAEEWLRTQAVCEELARQRWRQLRAMFDRCQLKVKEARTKLRQLTLLQERLMHARRTKENRAERVAEDEIGQRIAQAQRSRR
jgi:hypothetical protein